MLENPTLLLRGTDPVSNTQRFYILDGEDQIRTVVQALLATFASQPHMTAMAGHLQTVTIAQDEAAFREDFASYLPPAAQTGATAEQPTAAVDTIQALGQAHVE